MKKDFILIIIVAAIVVIILRSYISARLIFQLLLALLTIALFLYKQMKPHKAAIDARHLKWFGVIERFYDGILKFINIKPLKLGSRLSLDMSAMVVLTVYLSLFIIIK